MTDLVERLNEAAKRSADYALLWEAAEALAVAESCVVPEGWAYIEAVMRDNIQRAEDISEDTAFYLARLSTVVPSEGEMLGLKIVADNISVSLSALLAKLRAMLSAAPQPPQSGWQAIDDIAAERKRQIESEGWTPEHDDEHLPGELARAASSYAYAGSVATGRESILGQPESGTDFIMRLWPWDWSWWKPTNRRRDLVKAGALIVAEIERLDRADPPQPPHAGKEEG